MERRLQASRPLPCYGGWTGCKLQAEIGGAANTSSRSRTNGRVTSIGLLIRPKREEAEVRRHNSMKRETGAG